MVRDRYRKQWNPASAYLKAGTILSSVGIGITLLAVGVAGFALLMRWLQ